MSAFERPCGREDWHISHQFGIEHGDMGVAWYDCPGKTEHTALCDAWADMNGSECTCGLTPEPHEWREVHPTAGVVRWVCVCGAERPEPSGSALRYHEMTPEQVVSEAVNESTERE